MIDQWQLQELCKVMRKANVMMFSEGIQDEDRERVLVEMVPSVEGAIARVLDERGADARIAVIPKVHTSNSTAGGSIVKQWLTWLACAGFVWGCASVSESPVPVMGVGKAKRG